MSNFNIDSDRPSKIKQPFSVNLIKPTCSSCSRSFLLLSMMAASSSSSKSSTLSSLSPWPVSSGLFFDLLLPLLEPWCTESFLSLLDLSFERERECREREFFSLLLWRLLEWALLLLFEDLWCVDFSCSRSLSLSRSLLSFDSVSPCRLDLLF